MKDTNYSKIKYRWSAKYPETPSERLDGRKEQLEWIKRQLEYASFSERFKIRYELKRGEIYEIDWGINVNAEFSNRHYGVVLVDSDESNPLVTIIPLKSNRHGPNPKSDIDLGIIKDLNTKTSSLAVINQIRTIDKIRIYTKHAIHSSDMILSDSNNYDDVPKLEEYQIDLLMDAVNNFIQGKELQ